MAKKKKLNTRLVVLISVVLVAAIGFGAVAWFASRPKDPTYYYEQAKKALKQSPKQYVRAGEMFGRAIAGSKDNINQRNEYRYEYAMMCFERIANPNNDPSLTQDGRMEVRASGINTLKQAVEDNPAYTKARRQLADHHWSVAYSMQHFSHPGRVVEWNKLIEQLDAILKQQQDPEMYYRRATAERYLAEEDSSNIQLAEKDYRKAIATSKPGDENIAFRIGLGGYLESLGQTAEAEQEYKDAITANPKNADSYLGYAGFLLRAKRKEEGIKQIQAAIDNDPESEKGYIYMAQRYIGNKEPDKALKLLKSAPKNRIAGISIYAMEGGLYAHTGKLQDAVASYRAGLDAIDRQVSESEKPAMIRKLEKARVSLVARLAKTYLRIYAGQKGTPAAKEAMDQVEKYNDLLVKLAPESFEQLEMAGRIAYAKGDMNQARKCLEKARRLRIERANNAGQKQVPASPELTGLLWMVYERTGAPSKAKRELENLLAIPGQKKPAYVLALASYELWERDYKAARIHVKEVLAVDPDNEQAKKILRNLDIAENQKLPSGDTKLDTAGRNVMLQLVSDYVTDGKNDEAIDVLKKLLKSNPNDKRVLVALISLLMETDQKTVALEIINKAAKNSPDDKDLANWRNILQANDPAKVFEAQMQAMDDIKDPVSRDLRKRQLCLKQQKTDDADKYLKQAEKTNPSDPRVVAAFYTIAVKNKDWDAAQQAVDKLPAKEKLQRELYKGHLLNAQEKYGQAAEVFVKALQEKPNMTKVRLALTNCYLKQKNYDNAEKQLLIMVDNNSSNVDALVGLAKLAQQRQNLEDFEKWITMAYKHNAGKRHPFIKNAFLVHKVEKSDRKKAIAEREKIFQANPTDFYNAVRLAGLYESVMQIDKAQEKYEHILKRIPDKIDFSPTVADFYLRIGHPTKGYALFDSLLKTAKTPDEKASVLVHYGKFLTQIGEIPSAEGMYKKAIEADPKNPKGYTGLSDCYAMQADRFARLGQKPQADKAWNDSIAQLQKVRGLEPKNVGIQKQICYRLVRAGKHQEAINEFRNILQNDPEDKNARLNIAQIYQTQKDLPKATAELEGIIKDYPHYAEAYVTRAQICTARREFKKADAAYREALNIDKNLEWMLSRAQLNAYMGDTDAALSIYTDAITAFPDHPQAYVSKIDLLKARGELGQAKLLAESGLSNPVFEQVPNFAMLLAEVYKSRKQPQEEIAMLQKAVKIAPNNTQIIRYYLKALADQKNSSLQSEAAKYIEDPRQKPGVMGILAFANAKQHPNTPEAFERFYAALKECGPGDVSYVLNLMQQATGPQGLTANSAELEKINPASGEILYAIARAWTLQHKYPEAIAEYKKTLGLAKERARKVTTLLALASVYTAMKQDDNTEKTYRQVLEIDPDNKAALNNLAYLLADNLKRPREALPLSKKAMELEPGNANVVDTYAWILASLKEYKQAMSAYNEIKDRKLKNPEILYHIAFVAEKLEKYEMAEEYYQQALAAVQVFKNHPLTESIQQGLNRVKLKLEE